MLGLGLGLWTELRGSGGGATAAGVQASFDLPLTNLGAGIVSLVPRFSIGSATPTFTRASTAWTKLASGLWASIATGQARSTYFGQDTAVGAYAGFLQEIAATQIVTPTAAIRGMNDAAWVKTNVTAAKTATGIDGAANSASTLTATAGGGTCLLTVTAAASQRTYSAFVRRKTGTGTITMQQSGTTLDITALINSVTYTRVQINASILNVVLGFTIATNTDAIEVDFNQFEAQAAGLLASSPMDATGAARVADALTYASAGNIDFSQGTCFAQLSTLYTSAPAVSNAIFVATPGRQLFVASGGASTTISVNDTTTDVTKAGLTDMSTAVRKRASSWGAGGQVVTGDGAAPATGAFDGSMGAGATIGIGNGWRGTIMNVRIWNSQLQNNVLQSLTA